jgi:6-phosphogluconolactonase
VIHVLPDEVGVARFGARLIGESLRGHERSGRGLLTLVLSGGLTPRRAYEALAGKPGDGIPWGKVSVLWGDERCVPSEDKRSNYRMVAESGLLARPLAGVYRMPGDMPPEEGARAYEVTLGQLAPTNGPLRLDVVLLGVGDDGHIASLFPGSAALEERDRLVVATEGQGGVRRLTLTLLALSSARNLLFLVTGEAKAEAVQLTLGEVGAGVTPTPARLLMDTVKVRKSAGRECPTVTWVLDQAAASRLPARRLRLDDSAAPR